MSDDTTTPAPCPTTPRIEAARLRVSPECTDRATAIMARCYRVGLRGQDGDGAAEAFASMLDRACTNGEQYLTALENSATESGE